MIITYTYDYLNNYNICAIHSIFFSLKGPDKGDTLNHAKKRLFAPHDTTKGMSEQELIQELDHVPIL